MNKLIFLTVCSLLSGMLSIGQQYNNYLFVYFTGNDKKDESIHYALSHDGYKYTALNEDRPVIGSEKISSTGGVRDPHILRGADGRTFYMVATDMVSANGWNSNRAMVLLKSADLVSWSSAIVNIQDLFPGQQDLQRVWAPQTIYDVRRDRYLIYWAMKYRDSEDAIYCAYANKDFTGLESAPALLYTGGPGVSCIDADIIVKDGKFHLFFKMTEAHAAGIRQAVSDSLTGGYVLQGGYLQQTKDAVEGSAVFKLNQGKGYILMYDLYGSGKYQFTYSEDLAQFSVVDKDISMNFHPRHGTVMPVTAAEAARLTKKWPQAGGNNPVLKGYYADPEILYSKKNRKFYIYPTSDGFTGWSGTYFKTFSSPDLVHWTDEGRILELGKDVKWAASRAWAPCIEEKKIEGKYKYFYYFCAEAKIGVAIADDPAGPFLDAGKPLIDHFPEGIRNGQQIDPDVFTDPVSGKSYLYWGNGYMACAELGEDMVSLKEGTTKIITPKSDYREGSYVFYRKGRYYFMWSENDTRDPNYCVRYGYSDSPTGPIKTDKSFNMVITRDSAAGIYGTGHNSVLQIPGTDEWYLVYHRFHYPDGIRMGAAAGYNREVCIDRLGFNADGTIRQVRPTLKGVSAVKLK